MIAVVCAIIALALYFAEGYFGEQVKAMNAINYFMKGKALTNVRVLKDEAYPLLKGK